MARVIVTRSIQAPPGVVFETVADIRRFSQAIPEITKVEMLSEVTSGAGTRFRQTRLMHGKETATELQVTEYVPNERVRIVADSHGTVWDTLFTIAASPPSTALTMRMEAKAYRLLPRILNPLICGLIKKTVERDMDAVKSFCEKRQG